MYINKSRIDTPLCAWYKSIKLSKIPETSARLTDIILFARVEFINRDYLAVLCSQRVDPVHYYTYTQI